MHHLSVENFRPLAYFFSFLRTPLGTVFISCIIGLTSVAVHLIPFSSSESHPLGYDTGFYRRYLIQPFAHFPNTPVPGLGTDALIPRLIFDILRSTGFSPDFILYGTYIALFALLPPVIYILLKPRGGRRVALCAALLIMFSPIQFEAYWYMLWKNAWGMLLIFLAMLCIDRRSTVPLVLLEALLALSHKTSIIVYTGMLGTLSILARVRWKELCAHIVLVAAIAGAINFPALSHAARTGPVAIFVDLEGYIRMSLGLLLLAVFAYPAIRSRRVPVPVLALGAFALLFPLFRLPFFERMFIVLDICVAILAAYGVQHIVSRLDVMHAWRRTLAYTGMLCIAIGWTLGMWWNSLGTSQPLISTGDLQRIEAIGAIVPPGATILTSADEAPWYEGWTNAHIAAPGLLRDTHDFEEWMTLWDATSTEQTRHQTAMLADLPHPLYISSMESFTNLVGSPAPCLTMIVPRLLFDSCSKEE